MPRGDDGDSLTFYTQENNKMKSGKYANVPAISRKETLRAGVNGSAQKLGFLVAEPFYYCGFYCPLAFYYFFICF